MEYFIGSILTVAAILIIRLFTGKIIPENIFQIRYSQSNVYELIKDYIPSNSEMRKEPKTQSRNYLRSVSIRIVVVENEAYWIKDNIFYVAQMHNGEVQKESAKQVDTMSMDRVQLKKMMFIIEQLTEGIENDSRN